MKIPFLTLSDIHLGHDKNSTENIVKNLDKFFLKYKDIIIKVRIIFISGDVFDKLLSNNNADYIIAMRWLTKLVKFCSTYSIKLRILEGTPGHDWKQVKVLYKIIEDLEIEIDFKYFEELDIEIMDDYNISILYVPDEWKPTSKEIYKDVLSKLKLYDLEKVDIAIMHGAFSYQLPDFIEGLLNPDDYLKIVKGPIVIGHVHNRSMYKRIIVPGSFDALNHSDDDETKGGLLITYDNTTSEFNFKYLDNIYALKFKTINVVDKTYEELKKILSKFKKEEVHIRLLVGDDDNMSKNLLELKNMYPNIHFIIEKKNKKKKIKLKKNVVRIKKNLDNDTMLEYILEKASIDNIPHDLIIKEFEKITT